MFIKLKDIITESDSDHFDALLKTGFWGSRGAGCLILSKSTEKILVPFRSENVQEPHTWGVWGGAIDKDEDPLKAVLRELKEETGYNGDILKSIPLSVYKKKLGNDKEFLYHNFLVIIENEFEPTLNWETENSKWLTLEELKTLSPKHFGLEELLKKSSDKIKNEIRREVLKEEDVKLKDIQSDKKGSCMLYVELLTKKLLQRGIKNFNVIEGYVQFENKSPKFQHSWIEFENGKKFDKTLKQFNGWDLSTVKYFIKKKFKPEEYLGCSIEYPIKPEEFLKEDYIGNCVNILDDPSSPWNDATEMSYDVEENGIEISKEEFFKNIKDPYLRSLMSTIKPIEYGKNEDKGIYWILDTNDVHWFFQK